MMEKLLYYIWNNRLFQLNPLVTTQGDKVEVIDPGIYNRNAGPDFSQAKIKINDTLWAGSIEIHSRSTDWFVHKHQLDENYNKVVLHVTACADCEVVTQNGQVLPQLVLEVPPHLMNRYEELCRTTDYPRCHKRVPFFSSFVVHSWMDSLLYERMEQRSALVRERADALQGDWETAFFTTLARNFGFGVNGDAFELWSKHIPLKQLAHHRDNLFQVEAFFLGQAGLLAPDIIGGKEPSSTTCQDDYLEKLKAEYSFLAHKFNLTPMDGKEWLFLRLKPQNFPYIRLSQLAWLYHHNRLSLSKILEATSVEELCSLLSTQATTYWQTHYRFGLAHKLSEKKLTKSTLHLMIINTIVPTLFAYGMSHGKDEYSRRAQELLEQLPGENNYIIRMWQNLGIQVASAADTQAIIQLKKEYCDKRYCLHCRFGHEYLKTKNLQLKIE